MKNRYLKRTESGLNGINYALYIVVIVFVVVLYRYLTFRAGLYVVQQHLQDSLHIVGSSGLAYNYGDQSLYESDLNRLYVVDLAKGSTSKNWNEGEKQQALALGQWIASQYTAKMELKGDTETSPKVHPTDSMMTNMCGEDAEVILSDLIIYQPLYQRKVTKQSGNANAPFDVTYDFKWSDGEYKLVKYVYTMSENRVTDVKKEFYHSSDLESSYGDAVRLKGGKGSLVNGTTVDMRVKTVLYGLNNIFAGVSTETPSWGSTVKEYYSDGYGGYTEIEYRELDAPSETTGGFFSSNPTRMHYGIEVWEAVDIVPASNDSRAK